ncbi:MAG: porin family protein [Legionellales bacterium]|nr:porin family protein [Legionellales bacterium]
MKNKSSILLLAVLGFSAYASAGMNNTYVAVKGGFSGIAEKNQEIEKTKLVVDYKKTFNVGGTVGQKIDMFRGELEFNFMRAKVDKATFTPRIGGAVSDSSNTKTGRVMTVMLNGIYDIEVDPNITPYVGAGIGWLHFKSDFNNKLNNVAQTTSQPSSAFGFQFLAGAQYHINNIMSVFLEYKFLASTKVTISKFQNREYKHIFMSPYNINLGFKFVIA